jgi:hypothetical protein
MIGGVCDAGQCEMTRELDRSEMATRAVIAVHCSGAFRSVQRVVGEALCGVAQRSRDMRKALRHQILPDFPNPSEYHIKTSSVIDVEKAIENVTNVDKDENRHPQVT